MSKYNQYNWEGVRYGKRYKTTQADPLTRWILIAVLLAIVCHVIVLVAMKKMPIFFQSDTSSDRSTRNVVVRDVEDREYIQTPSDNIPQDEINAPTDTADAFLEELAMLEETPEDIEMDFSPEIDAPDISVPMEAPAMAGSFDASAMDLTSGMDISEIVEDLGSTDDFLKAAAGQITIDPGKQAADEFDPDLFNVELAKGAGGETRDGVLEGFTPLSEMTRLSQSDLAKAKGMIGSDLLFEFNKATLRESAKNSLLKVVLLIDKNPNMKCWIEGHTDLIGSEEENVKLSIARAEAVRYWLVHSMKISDSRLFVIGLGESKPIVLAGDQYEQAINRRVEIKMRNSPPPVINREPEADADTVTEVIRKPRIIKPLRNPNQPEAREEIPVDRRPTLPADQTRADRDPDIPALRPLPVVEPFVEPEEPMIPTPIPAPIVEKIVPKAIPVPVPVPIPIEIPIPLPLPEPVVDVVPKVTPEVVPQVVPLPIEPVPPRAVPVEETEPEPSVNPSRAIPVETLPDTPPQPLPIPEPVAPKAVPVEEPAVPTPKAVPESDKKPAIDAPPKAIPVE